LAGSFAAEGYSSLSIDFRGYGNSTAPTTNEKYRDILAAIKYLSERGYLQINIIGGSMGGAAALEALSRIDQGNIANVVLLAPAGGPPIQSPKYNKLFIVSKNEGLNSRVKTIYEESADPKEIKVFDGSAHAQHMFKEDYAEDLTQLIIDFIKE
jgi:pimeloyl-ACP methyl ester carboxylesterase